MRILRIISSMNPQSGGPAQGIRNTIPALQKLKIHNEVVCLDEPDATFIKNDSFPVHAVGKAKGPWKYNGVLYTWLMENLSRFDTIIIHGLWLYHGYAATKAVKSFKKLNPDYKLNVYIMPHGMLDPWFQEAEGRKLKAIRNWLYWKFIERNTIHQANAILFTCEEELNLAKKSFSPYEPKNEINVGYGIAKPAPFTPEMEKEFRSVCSLNNNSSYILFLGRIHEKKGVDLLIKSYLNLKSQNYILPKLVIAGPGLETTFGNKIRQMAADPDILFPGMLTGKSKWGAYYGCEAFILPSHQENFGISVVEALACAKPVLISNQINIWREILNGACGIIESDTQEGTMKLLTKWINLTEQEKEKMSQNALDTYENLFAIDPVAQTLKEALSI